MLEPFFFLVYINDLAEGLVSDVRLFGDDTSLFSIVYDEQVSANILIHLKKNGHISGKYSLIQTKISKPFKLFSHIEKADQFILPSSSMEVKLLPSVSTFRFIF